MNPLKPEQEVWRAESARQILENPLVKEALDDIDRRLIDEWSRTPVKDNDMRERLWMMFNIKKAFVSKLQEHIETGKLASMQIKQPKKFGIF